MSKKAPFLAEISIGLVLSALIAFAYQRGNTAVEIVSLKTYDVLARLSGPAPLTDNVRIVAIDQESVENLGRWPWPRALTAQLIDQVVASGAKVIGLNVFFTDPDRNQGLEAIERLEERYREVLAEQAPALAKKKVSIAGFEDFLNRDMADAKTEMNGDAILKQSIEQAVSVVLPMYFMPGEALGNVPALPAFFDKEKLALPAELPAPAGQAATLPLEDFGNVALAVGHANFSPDSDGTLRRVPLVMQYGNTFYPSFPLQIAREFLRLQRDALKWDQRFFELNKAKIPTDESGQTYVRYAGPAGTIKSFSALNVLSDGLPEKALQDKIVLIGLTAPGAADGTVMVAPGGERITGLEILANHLENILAQSFVSRPEWAPKAEWGAIGLAALVVMIFIPLMRARFAVPVAALFLAAMLGGSYFLFVKQGVWVSPAYGVTLLVTGFVVLVGKRLVFTEKGKEMVEAEGVETNKMLGLSFQGQGMLDLAFEKFRRCPMDNAMKELLYNLGLDMERKRMFSKAAAVYEHIGTFDKKYKDIVEKIELLKKANEGAVFGGLGKKGSDATVVVAGLGQATTLGRYEVVKELGRGAMGIVYLGRDPKINRQVAIKTLRFEEEVDDSQAAQIKERFFREAESAGNLTHPNIIRIFDAGEDQDVAYIAMELIEGEDLKKYCDKTRLLPMPRVLDMMIHVASGLDYAHKQGVVHRDIKPGNIMLLKDGTLRITDFGIARIQAASKTATGAVLGTPAYMSPEQVNGKKADGRADVFSLGVTLFEMLTGEKPFSADTVAALLYRIANGEHPNPKEFNPNIPDDLVAIINKSLAKDPANRFQTAGEMGEALKVVLNKLSSATTEVPAQASAPAAASVPPAPAKTAPVLNTQPEIPAAPAAPRAPVEPKIIPPAGFETNQLMTPEAAKNASTEADFLSELQQTFELAPDKKPAEPKPAAPAAAAPAAPAPAAPKAPEPAIEQTFRILQNNDVLENFGSNPPAPEPPDTLPTTIQQKPDDPLDRKNAQG